MVCRRFVGASIFLNGLSQRRVPHRADEKSAPRHPLPIAWMPGGAQSPKKKVGLFFTPSGTFCVDGCCLIRMNQTKNMPSQKTLPAVVTHGADCLPSVEVDDYNVELKDDEGFVGNRASKGAFRDIISHWAGGLSKPGMVHLGDADSDALSKTKLDDIFTRGDPAAAGLV